MMSAAMRRMCTAATATARGREGCNGDRCGLRTVVHRLSTAVGLLTSPQSSQTNETFATTSSLAGMFLPKQACAGIQCTHEQHLRRKQEVSECPRQAYTGIQFTQGQHLLHEVGVPELPRPKLTLFHSKGPHTLKDLRNISTREAPQDGYLSSWLRTFSAKRSGCE